MPPAFVLDTDTFTLWQQGHPEVCRRVALHPADDLASITRGASGPASCLLPEPLEPVRQLRSAFALVGKLRDQQREGLGVSGDA